MLSGHKVIKMEGEEEGSKSLPEELVEKIVAMLPFPSIFKTRLLSKSWLARFKPISSHYNEERKRCAKLFQKQVRESSNKWETFGPVCVTKDDLFAYSQGCQKWRRLPALSFLPKNLFLTKRNLQGPTYLYRADKHLHIEGPLLYGIWEDLSNIQFLWVANILTQKWKLLPPRPGARSYNARTMKLVSNTSSQTYKLILSCEERLLNEPYLLQIYDSKLETWITKKFEFTGDFRNSPSTFAHLNGVLYGVSFKDPMKLMAFNLEEGTMEELRSTLNYVIGLATAIRLVACNANLMMILSAFQSKDVLILKMDFGSLQWLEVARCPSAAFKLDRIDIPVRDINCVFLEDEGFDGVMLVYNENKDEWSFFKFPKQNYQWSAFSFQPGLNPFMEV